MRIISLASGAGLWDNAWEDVGAEIILQCEKSSPQTDILKKTFPKAQLDYDIFSLTKEKMINEYGLKKLEECTIIGGLCCQPFSTMGKARGKEKDTWMCDELVRITSESRVRIVVTENVEGFIEHRDGLSYVVKEMERIGYRGHSLCISASTFGAPHQRKRIFSFFFRDYLEKLVDPAGSGRLSGLLLSACRNRRCIPGIYNRRCTSKPGIRGLVDGAPTKFEEDYLRILGNGVEYETGYFIANIVKTFHDYFYENLEGREILKIPYNPY